MLCIVDHAGGRLIHTSACQKVEEPESDERRLRRRSLLHAGGDAQRRLLSRGQLVDVLDEGSAQPLECTVRDRGLHFDALRAQHTKTGLVA
nr:hypothetical protein [Microbacterium trichothecenolyticum]